MTFNRDVDTIILSYIDDETLFNTVTLNTYFNDICNDNYLWKLKIDRLYPGLPIPIEYYDKKKDVYILCKDPPHSIANFAAENGYVEVVLYFINNYKIHPSQEYVGLATKNGHINVMEILLQLNIRPLQDYVNDVASNGDLDMLKLLERYDIFIYDTGVKNAIINDHLNILEHINKTRKRYLSPRVAAAYGKVEVLKLFIELDIHLDQECANKAAYWGYIEVLELCELYNIFSDQKTADYAATKGQLHVLQWLISKNIKPTVNWTNEYQVIERLEKMALEYSGENFSPDDFDVEYIIEHLFLDIIDMLHSTFDIRLNVTTLEYVANTIICYGSKNLNHHFNDDNKIDENILIKVINWLDWLKSQNIYPNGKFIDHVMNNGNITIINWLKENII